MPEFHQYRSICTCPGRCADEHDVLFVRYVVECERTGKLAAQPEPAPLGGDGQAENDQQAAAAGVKEMVRRAAAREP